MRVRVGENGRVCGDDHMEQLRTIMDLAQKPHGPAYLPDDRFCAKKSTLHSELKVDHTSRHRQITRTPWEVILM